MRKGRDGNGMEEKMENNGENSGPLTSLPVDCLTATDCNADRSCQKQSKGKKIRKFQARKIQKKFLRLNLGNCETQPKFTHYHKK